MSAQLCPSTLEFDEQGYLLCFEAWYPAIAEEMSSADDVGLTENHWEVIGFLRDYFTEYRVAPAIRLLTRTIGQRLGKEKGNTKYLYQLFPLGPARQACRYAGLPKPTGCV